MAFTPAGGAATGDHGVWTIARHYGAGDMIGRMTINVAEALRLMLVTDDRFVKAASTPRAMPRRRVVA